MVEMLEPGFVENVPFGDQDEYPPIAGALDLVGTLEDFFGAFYSS